MINFMPFCNKALWYIGEEMMICVVVLPSNDVGVLGVKVNSCRGDSQGSVNLYSRSPLSEPVAFI